MPGLYLYSFSKDILGFLMTTESEMTPTSCHEELIRIMKKGVNEPHLHSMDAPTRGAGQAASVLQNMAVL